METKVERERKKRHRILGYDGRRVPLRQTEFNCFLTLHRKGRQRRHHVEEVRDMAHCKCRNPRSKSDSHVMSSNGFPITITESIP